MNAERARWVKLRQHGLLRFVVLRGVLLWGLSTGTLWLLVTTAFREGLSWSSLSGEAFGRRALVALAIFPAVGVLYAVRRWVSLSRRHGSATGPNDGPTG